MTRKEVQDSVPELPEGWEFAEPKPRRPLKGEWYWDQRVIESTTDHDTRCIRCPSYILRLIKTDPEKERREALYKLVRDVRSADLRHCQTALISQIEEIFRRWPPEGK